MRKKIKRIVSHPLISGTFFILSGGMIGNFFNFVFNLIMSRNLRVEDYGTLVSIIAISSLAAIPAGSVIPTIISVAGSYFARKEEANLKSFYFKMFKPLFAIGLLFVVVIELLSKQIGTFLNIRDPLILFLAATIILVGYISIVNLAFLQARLSFKTISVSNILSALVKVLFGFVLVILGYGVGGAVFSFLLSMIVPVVVGFIVLRKILLSKYDAVPKLKFKEMFAFGIPSSLAMFSLSALISTDIILVKHFFSTESAGIYAGLSLVGKVIFYLTAPISTVMFPTIIHRYNKNENYKRVMLLSLLIVIASSTFAVLFYYLFPNFVLLFFLKNPLYLKASSLLGLYGIFIGLYSVISIFVYFFLSIKRTNVSYLVMGSALLQALLIMLFHSSFTIIIFDSIASLSLLLILLLLYYFISKENK